MNKAIINLGLERITKISQYLGDPHLKFKSIHIAGTNGKGSVAAYLANILRCADYEVGLYTSPHLVNYNERFQINTKPINNKDLERIASQVKNAVADIEEKFPDLKPITPFEIATAIAFVYFAENKVDIAVIEVGLGGRLDATNIINPEIAVITPIGYDHMEYLGDSLRAIAQEKAGIIKPEIPVVSSNQPFEAQAVLLEKAKKCNTYISFIKDSQWSPVHWDLEGGMLKFPLLSNDLFTIKMLGYYQLENAVTSLAAVKILKEKGYHISISAVLQGLSQTYWPGRFEVVSKVPWVLLDGAHNYQGISALANTLKKLLEGKKITFVMGILENKDSALIDYLLPQAKKFIFTKPQDSRIPPKDPTALQEYAEKNGVEALAFNDASQAISCLNKESHVCICGSLYLIGEIKQMQELIGYW